MKRHESFNLIVSIALAFNSIRVECATDIVLERAVIECNSSFIVNCSASVTKRDRKAPYVFNLNIKLLENAGDNVTMTFDALEYRSNQYKPSVIHFEISGCQFLSDKNLVFPIIAKYTNLDYTCPTPAGVKYVKDLIIRSEVFPSAFPDGKWKCCAAFRYVRKRELMLKVCVDFKVSRKLVQDKRRRVKN